MRAGRSIRVEQFSVHGKSVLFRIISPRKFSRVQSARSLLALRRLPHVLRKLIACDLPAVIDRSRSRGMMQSAARKQADASNELNDCTFVHFHVDHFRCRRRRAELAGRCTDADRIRHDRAGLWMARQEASFGQGCFNAEIVCNGRCSNFTRMFP